MQERDLASIVKSHVSCLLTAVVPQNLAQSIFYIEFEYFDEFVCTSAVL